MSRDDQTPMRRVRAPGRVNLIGDHTDYTGGLVLPFAIDRQTTIEYRPAERIELRSADESEPVSFDHRQPPEPASVDSWGKYVAAVVGELGPERGLDGVVETDIPIGSGLSSSAALEVAVAIALGFDGTPVELAELCRRAEHAATGVRTGIMDQLCIAAATEGHAALIDCHSLVITHVPLPPSSEVEFVVRFVAGRTLEGSEYDTRVAECARAEELIGPLRLADLDAVATIDDPVIRSRARHVVSENKRVRDYADALAAGDLAGAGAIMVDGHRSLRDDYATSIPVMDAAVDELMATPGVLGARMTGGGFGGCVVAMSAPGTNLDGWPVVPVAGAGHE
ncbi:MAG: galactokinase family protein [Actinomycetota bacterium]